MKNFSLCKIIVLLTLFIGSSSVYSKYLPWPMLMSDAQRTGEFHPTIGERGTMDTVSIKWTRAVSTLASATIGNIDTDNGVEVVVGGTDSRLYALRGADGTIKWNRTLNGSLYSSTPTLGDIDGDSAIEIVVGTLSGTVYAVSGNLGTIKWSNTVASELAASPVIGDVDGNASTVEIVICSKTSTFCLNGATGSTIWTATTGTAGCSNEYCSPAIGDIDNTPATTEVIVSSNNMNVYALNGTNGSVKWTCRTDSGGAMGGTPPYVLFIPSIRDIDGDGITEVMSYKYFGVFVINGLSGVIKWGYVNPGCPSSLGANAGVATGDIDNDGRYEVLFHYHGINALDENGVDTLWSYVFPSDQTVHSNPIFADVDGDANLEVIGANHKGYVACLEGDGSLKWDLQASPNDIHPTHAIGDIDGDGCLEIVGCVNNGPVYAIESKCPTSVEEAQSSVEGNKLTVLQSKNKITVLFNIERMSDVAITIFDISGKEINSMGMGRSLKAGNYSANLNIDEFKNGIYFVRASLGEKSLSQKIVIIK
ncbi:MAG: PQQ-binding-like beta-propeller repeat protein [bacterium]|nr:PQQ-binding-like beta-propeller repeat protein [bacterium]